MRFQSFVSGVEGQTHEIWHAPVMASATVAGCIGHSVDFTWSNRLDVSVGVKFNKSPWLCVWGFWKGTPFPIIKWGIGVAVN